MVPSMRRGPQSYPGQENLRKFKVSVVKKCRLSEF